MYSYNYSDNLKRILKKLYRKDKSLYEQLLKKIEEVINSYNVENYKNLRHNMKDSKRVHIGHFVLVFQYNKNSNTILFDDFDHHDNIYKIR
jgi:YafQ family addiction module toxin component